MSRPSELPCWEITLRSGQQKSLTGGEEIQPCWELVKNEITCAFHVCLDCLVYLAQQENSLLSEEEFCSILKQRKEKGIRQYECTLTRMFRS